MSAHACRFALAWAVLLAGCAAKDPGRPATAAAGRSTGQRAGGLFFDPLGADFGPWVRRFRDEVYRHWIPPKLTERDQQARSADVEFVVQRDGSISAVRILKSTDRQELDDAAVRALRSCRLPSLPKDYPLEAVTIQVSFTYDTASR
jgi:TonB family protein